MSDKSTHTSSDHRHNYQFLVTRTGSVPPLSALAAFAAVLGSSLFMHTAAAGTVNCFEMRVPSLSTWTTFAMLMAVESLRLFALLEYSSVLSVVFSLHLSHFFFLAFPSAHSLRCS